jgi:hypothetical protein
MCPDNDTPAPAEQNPTLAEDDKNRRTVEPSSGPNVNGYDDLVKRRIRGPIPPTKARTITERHAARRARRRDERADHDHAADRRPRRAACTVAHGGLIHGALS